jgi:hypothetical protein
MHQLLALLLRYVVASETLRDRSLELRNQVGSQNVHLGEGHGLGYGLEVVRGGQGVWECRKSRRHHDWSGTGHGHAQTRQ